HKPEKLVTVKYSSLRSKKLFVSAPVRPDRTPSRCLVFHEGHLANFGFLRFNKYRSIKQRYLLIALFFALFLKHRCFRTLPAYETTWLSRVPLMLCKRSLYCWSQISDLSTVLNHHKKWKDHHHQDYRCGTGCEIK